MWDERLVRSDTVNNARTEVRTHPSLLIGPKVLTHSVASLCQHLTIEV